MNYLKMLVDEFHSTVVATLDQQGYPQTRAIDMMLYDKEGVYFLTAKGKTFYQQLIQKVLNYKILQLHVLVNTMDYHLNKFHTKQITI